MSFLVIVPIRKRPEQLKRFIESFDSTVDDADLMFVMDGDDDSYEGFDFKGHACATISPRATVVQKLNEAAGQMVDSYDYLMTQGDDCEFVTPHWDTKLVAAMRDLGSGWVYANNQRRKDIPEAWMTSTDVVKSLGWFAPPFLNHYYVDNVISVLGKRTSLLRYVPDVLIPHHHYTTEGGDAYDPLYKECETLFGEVDLKAFQGWVNGNQAALDVSRLRREFNPDVQWVLGKV